MKYATVNQLKNHLKVTTTDSDSYFDDVLTHVSLQIDQYTGRQFGVAEVTVTNELHEFQSRVTRSVWLKNVNITEITALEAKDASSDAWTVLDVDDYDWTTLGRLNLSGYRYVRVSYKYSGGGTTVPGDIVRAALDLAAAEVASGTSDVAKTRIGDLEMQYDAASTDTKSAYALLDQYRVRSV
jgi:hypothetical protein